ncbi:MAG: MiaB/RimO family radical SAM methylthiotransferase, partial [bacterium]
TGIRSESDSTEDPEGAFPTRISMRKVSTFDELSQDASATHTRTFVKIQDGCSHGCTYCIIPALRGRERSLPPERVLEVLDDLDVRGVPEVVLTGIHLAAYGRDLLPKTTLATLVRAIARRDYRFRVRLSSLEPQDVREDMAEAVFESIPKVCPHFHLPLQSGSDRVLKAMRRGYTADKFEALVERVRAVHPGFGISTDVIVGFPGETEEDFEATLELAKRTRFVRIHAFPYSVRPGTPAADMPQVPVAVKREREKRLIAAGSHLTRKQVIQSVGAAFEVVAETESRDHPGYREGYTGNYLPALVKSDTRGARIKGRAVAALGERVVIESDGG